MKIKLQYRAQALNVYYYKAVYGLDLDPVAYPGAYITPYLR